MAPGLGTRGQRGWNGDRNSAVAHAAELRAEIGDAMKTGRAHEYLPLTGQSAGLVHEILPVREIVARMVAGAEQALGGLRGSG